MRGNDFDQEIADRLLDGPSPAGVPDELAQVSDLLEDVRLLAAAMPDPVREAETVRAMRSAVDGVLGGKEGRRRPRRLFPVGFRSAIAVGAIALVGAANAAADGPLPDGGVADAVLDTLGIAREDDEADRVADELERQREEAERAAAAAKELAATAEKTPTTQTTPAEAGTEKAAENRRRALEFTTAKKAWTRCVAEKAPQHDPGSGRFDPIAACGPKPRPKTDADETQSGERGAGRRGPPPHAGPPAHAGPPPKAKTQSKPRTDESSGSTSKPAKKPKQKSSKKNVKAAAPPAHAGP